jgi:hypothetical protein
MDVCDEARAFTGGQVAQIVGDQKVRFQLIKRASSVPEKLFELSARRAPLSFGNVGGDGSGCPANLTREAVDLMPREIRGQTVHIGYKSNSLLPDNKFAIVQKGHTGGLVLMFAPAHRNCK